MFIKKNKSMHKGDPHSSNTCSCVTCIFHPSCPGHITCSIIMTYLTKGVLVGSWKEIARWELSLTLRSRIWKCLGEYWGTRICGFLFLWFLFEFFIFTSFYSDICIIRNWYPYLYFLGYKAFYQLKHFEMAAPCGRFVKFFILLIPDFFLTF